MTAHDLMKKYRRQKCPKKYLAYLWFIEPKGARVELAISLKRKLMVKINRTKWHTMHNSVVAPGIDPDTALILLKREYQMKKI